MRQQYLLGTAQWGLDYGITNLTGRISDRELTELVNQARRIGVNALDTAPAYGDAHTRIGEVGRSFAVQTKVSASGRSGMQIRQDLDDSLVQLGQQPIWRVLVHDWPELQAHERSLVVTVLNQFRDSGMIESFGVSVYRESDLSLLPNEFGEITVVQVPVSIMDQRLCGSDVVATLREQGMKFQARSIFLQGILLTGTSRFARHPDLETFHKLAKERELNPLDLCVSFIRAQEWIDEVVLGVTSSIELNQIVDSFDTEPLQLAWEGWASTSLELLDPRTWSRA